MEFTQLLSLIQDKSATLILAIVSLWMLNRSWIDRSTLEQRYAADIRALHESVLSALDGNTKALTVLVERWTDNSRR